MASPKRVKRPRSALAAANADLRKALFAVFENILLASSIFENGSDLIPPMKPPSCPAKRRQSDFIL